MAEKAAVKKTSRQARKTPVDLKYPISIEALYKRTPAGADLSDILDVPSLKQILESVTKMTGMGTAILDVKGNILVATGWQDICTKFHRVNPQTSENCTESDLFLAENVRPGEYVEYRCRNSLWDVVTPLYFGDKHVGNIYTGQFFYVDDEIDLDYFVKQAAEYGFNKDDYLAALRQVPRVTHKQVKDLMDFLIGFTEIIARQGRHDLNLKKAIEKGKRIQADLVQSERHYRELFENMLEGFALCKMLYDKKGQPIDWIYLDVNVSFERLTGLSNMVGKKVSEVLPGIDKTNPELFTIYGRVAKTGAPHEFETWVEPVNEWLHISVFSPEEDHFVAIFEDITERKLAEQAIKASEERLRSIIDAAPFGAHVYQLEEDGRLVYVSGNAAADRMLGINCDRFTGMTLEEAFPGLVDTGLPSMYRRVAATGKACSIEQLSYDAAGITGIFEIHAAQTSPNQMVTFFRDVTETTQARQELEISHMSLEESFVGLIKALSATVETRDPYTAIHQKRVTELAMAIAKEAGLPSKEADGLYMAGLIHDIGKIYVPGEILSKPGKLSDIEYRLVRTHSDAGYRIIKGIKFTRPVADIVHQHHERLDGSGYPNGLKGKDILPEARILAVADVVEAMASHRPYRPSLGIDAALSEIKKNRGKLYDAKIVDICVAIFTENGFTFTD